LTDWPVPHDTIDTAELCVSELVTNAVIHTGTAAELTARLEADVLTLLTAVPSSHMTRARDNLGDARPMA
jgi:hypothetical protein